MPSFNISLSEELKKYVEAQIKGGAYNNISEYFRSLIRDHQKRVAQERLEMLLLEGLESGDTGTMKKSDWNKLRQQAISRAKKNVRGMGGKKKAK